MSTGRSRPSSSRPAQVVEYVYFAGEYTAPFLLGYALWRSRRVPRWLAVLFTAGLFLAEQQGAIGPKVVLFMLPFAVAMTLLAARIWRAAARPAPVATPEPADHAGQLAHSSKGL